MGTCTPRGSTSYASGDIYVCMYIYLHTYIYIIIYIDR